MNNNNLPIQRLIGVSALCTILLSGCYQDQTRSASEEELLIAKDRATEERLLLEMQAAAVANGLYVAVANRAGVDDTLTFFGRSFAVDPHGQVVARAPEDDVALLPADLDLGLVEEARRDMPFIRDRRPETYGPIVEPN